MRGSVAADSDSVAGLECSLMGSGQRPRDTFPAGFLPVRLPDMHGNSPPLQSGSPGGAHVVRIRMRENDAVQALVGVPAFLQSLRHGSRAEPSVQKKTVDGSVVSAQKQGGIATAR